MRIYKSEFLYFSEKSLNNWFLIALKDAALLTFWGNLDFFLASILLLFRASIDSKPVR